METVRREYEQHQKEHNLIDKFQEKLEKCRAAEVRFHGEELQVYGKRLNGVQKDYSELLSLSNKRASDLQALNAFLQAANKGKCEPARTA